MLYLLLEGEGQSPTLNLLPAFLSYFNVCHGVIHVILCCAIWYHLNNFKNVKNTHRGMLLLVKLQVTVCNFTMSNCPSWVFFQVNNKDTRKRCEICSKLNVSPALLTLLQRMSQSDICDPLGNLVSFGGF